MPTQARARLNLNFTAKTPLGALLARPVTSLPRGFKTIAHHVCCAPASVDSALVHGNHAVIQLIIIKGLAVVSVKLWGRTDETTQAAGSGADGNWFTISRKAELKLLVSLDVLRCSKHNAKVIV